MIYFILSFIKIIQSIQAVLQNSNKKSQINTIKLHYNIWIHNKH